MTGYTGLQKKLEEKKREKAKEKGKKKKERKRQREERRMKEKGGKEEWYITNVRPSSVSLYAASDVVDRIGESWKKEADVNTNMHGGWEG